MGTNAPVPNGASYIQLYSAEDPKEDNRVQWEVKQAAVIQKDEKSDRDWKWRAQGFKFADANGANEYDLKDRFVATEDATTYAHTAALLGQ